MKSSRSSSSRHCCPRLDLLLDVARHRRRLEDAAQRLDAGHDGLAVLLRRQIVRVDRGRLMRIGGLDPYMASSLRPQQRAHAGDAWKRMQLAADRISRIERDRALRVRRRRRRMRAHEAAGRDRRDRKIAAPGEAVAQSGRDLSPTRCAPIVERDRLLAAQDDAAGIVVVEPIADARNVGDHRDAERGEQRRPARTPKAEAAAAS